MTLRIAVTAADVTVGGVTVGGAVTVREGSGLPWVRPLRNGVAVLRLRGVQPGRHSYRVSYRGGDGVLPSTAEVSVRVRRPHSAS